MVGGAWILAAFVTASAAEPVVCPEQRPPWLRPEPRKAMEVLRVPEDEELEWSRATPMTDWRSDRELPLPTADVRVAVQGSTVHLRISGLADDETVRLILDAEGTQQAWWRLNGDVVQWCDRSNIPPAARRWMGRLEGLTAAVPCEASAGGTVARTDDVLDLVLNDTHLNVPASLQVVIEGTQSRGSWAPWGQAVLRPELGRRFRLPGFWPTKVEVVRDATGAATGVRWNGPDDARAVWRRGHRTWRAKRRGDLWSIPPTKVLGGRFIASDAEQVRGVRLAKLEPATLAPVEVSQGGVWLRYVSPDGPWTTVIETEKGSAQRVMLPAGRGSVWVAVPEGEHVVLTPAWAEGWPVAVEPHKDAPTCPGPI